MALRKVAHNHVPTMLPRAPSLLTSVQDSTLDSILLRPFPAVLSTARFGCVDDGANSPVNTIHRVYIKTANDRTASGHRVSCVDLAGAAGSLVDSNDVTSFDQYDAPLVDFMAALPDGGHKDSTLASILLRPWPAALSTARFGCIDEGVQSTVNLAEARLMGMAKEHFVLVHGEGHGAWCWFKLRWLLEGSGSGYRVTCIDLSGGGVDPTDPNTVLSFKQYDKPLIDLISTLPEGEKGLPTLPENEIELTLGAAADDPPTTIALRPEFQRDQQSQQSPEEESVLASMLMRPWPAKAISTASFEGDDERLNRVKRIFIKTQRDHMLDPEQQDSMIKKWPPSEVLVIDTDHSPFFSAPEQLFNLIVKSL
ncbi:hypothetical protein HU200_050013 [Digitaria exilis]|uniref:AB hydrolase-1 domain-containing protein n=1 Tax=Digitaria exilis TaxID=1010633 RepID=A0A835EBH9_9POAL|nr:hypothetical protein HU200_050013 [Digitaria exilis]